MSGTLGQIIRLGLKSLFLQKMRSALAALGIFIGTTTVIWLVAMGEGVSYQAQQQILELGATNIIVRSVEPNASGGDKNRVKSYGLLRADFRRILSNVPTITRAVPIRELRRECCHHQMWQPPASAVCFRIVPEWGCEAQSEATRAGLLR